MTADQLLAAIWPASSSPLNVDSAKIAPPFARGICWQQNGWYCPPSVLVLNLTPASVASRESGRRREELGGWQCTSKE
jgi:hypothetical protein